MEKEVEELKSLVRRRKVILFAGSGLSKCLGLPSWQELMKNFGTDLGFHEDIFLMQGNFLELAEFFQLEKKNLKLLCERLSQEWHNEPSKILDSDIHKSIVELNFPSIFTTNYDNWLEIAHEKFGAKFHTIKTQGDLASLSSGEPSVTTIFKYHGDLSAADEIVLTDTIYFKRLSLNSPMDIRLRSEALSHAILFLGYSLSDINVRYLLYELHNIRMSFGGDKDHKTYIFLTTPNEIQERILRSRNIIPIYGRVRDPLRSTADFLKELGEK